MPTVRVAAAQFEPVILDAKPTLSKACDIVRQAGEAGVQLVVFPETFVPGYAQWAHASPFESDAHKRLYARLAKESLLLPDDLASVQDAARRARCAVAIGVTERDVRTPGTLYNTLAYIGPEGAFLGKHRKLVPTHHERTVYGYGGGDTLRAIDVPLQSASTQPPSGGRDPESFRVGGLLCWNNYMPLARYALYAQGIQVYLAPTADDLPSWQTTMKFIARESRCFVIGAALLQRKSSFPADFELAGSQAWEAEDEWNERGGSCIVAPDGEHVVEPVYEKEGLLVADIDLDRVVAERLGFDPAGHYARREVLKLIVEGFDGSPL